jgi:hypothetical protein
MGLLEYVPAMTTFDYLIVAFNEELAVYAARYIQRECKLTCGLLTAFGLLPSSLLTGIVCKYQYVLYLYNEYYAPLLLTMIPLHINSIFDAVDIATLILKRRPIVLSYHTPSLLASE